MEVRITLETPDFYDDSACVQVWYETGRRNKSGTMV